MKLVHNPDIQKRISKLTASIKETADYVNMLQEMVTDAEVDDIDALDVYRNNVFEIGQRMFNEKMELLKIQKEIDKHIAHTLNPIPKTAPKKGARKEKSVVHVKDVVSTRAITIKKKGGGDV